MGREVLEAGIPALAQGGSASLPQQHNHAGDHDDGQLLEEQLRSLAPQEFLLLLQALLGATGRCLRHVAAVQQ